MAFFQYLVFDGENLLLPDSYEVELEDVEADSGGDGGGDDTEGCGAAWGCEHSGVVFCYGEVVEEAGRVCEEG